MIAKLSLQSFFHALFALRVDIRCDPIKTKYRTNNISTTSNQTEANTIGESRNETLTVVNFDQYFASFHVYGQGKRFCVL